MKVRLTAMAERDLDDIWVYLAVEASEETATRIADGIWSAALRLEAFPYSGSPRDEPLSEVRLLVHGPYSIYHVVLESEVVVTRIAHGSRDAGALMDLGRTR